MIDYIKIIRLLQLYNALVSIIYIKISKIWIVCIESKGYITF